MSLLGSSQLCREALVKQGRGLEGIFAPLEQIFGRKAATWKSVMTMISFHEGKIISKKKPKYQNNKSDFGRLRNREAKQKPSRNSVLFICLRQGHLLPYSLRSQALTFFPAKLSVILHSLVPSCYFLWLPSTHQKKKYLIVRAAWEDQIVFKRWGVATLFGKMEWF